MTHTPARRGLECSLIVNTFEKPRHLALVLESIAAQTGVAGRIEVVVTDDGSHDDTAEIVSRFAGKVSMPVRFTSEPHAGFRAARVRNRGARMADGAYLLFLDGDCVLPTDHVAAHLSRRRPGVVQLGYCARLPEDTSRSLVPERFADIDLDRITPPSERRSLRRRHMKAWWHTLLRHPSKPRLAAGNFGIWRDDFERVNGFDERFVGWGQEDDDLGLRLRAAGLRLRSILRFTHTLHVWHPVDPSATLRWRDGPNVDYFLRRGRLTCCRRGLRDRSAAEILWGLPDSLRDTALGQQVAAAVPESARAAPGADCEIDVVVRPGRAMFTRRAECRLLIAAPDATLEPDVVRRADRVARIGPAEVDGLLADAG